MSSGTFYTETYDLASGQGNQVMVDALVIRSSTNRFAVACLHCAKAVAVPITPLRQQHAPVNLVCEDCGHTFQMTRDERRFPRKPFNLAGMLLAVSTHKPLGRLTITDLSLSGLRGSVTHATPLQVGARYRVVFRLNDALQSEIQEDIVVQQLYDAQTFGAEFHPSDRYNFELDFHLHPWTVASTS
jgi:hypothetical protein